jgi:actinorhodin biosynthesis protein ActVIA
MKGGDMLKKGKSCGAIMLVVSALAIATVHAQQQPTNAATKAPGLTAADYVEIQQLVARYGYAVDTHADNGYAYADLFAPDGVFGGKTSGREQLAALARSTQAQRGGPSYTRHFVTNVIIHPTPEGARGSQYLVAIDVAEDGKPSTVVHGGRYDDVYVKTPQGWRFKTRQYIPSQIGVPPPTAKLPSAR